MNIKELVSKMTLEEKAGLCSGKDFWRTKAVERLGIPALMVSDGPHGLRKQADQADHLGINESIKAVCFPAGCATAASFDKELVENMGKVLGNECQAENVGVILGPAVNIKRSPLCGRNFEYFSEDPLVASQIAEHFIKGVQSKNVGTSLKHFLANNQEHRRMTSSSQVDDRTLREIYLAAFEGAVVNAKPWTVMCSYNKINGVYAAENRKYLTEVLREEWGFDGFVVSDWGAVNNRVPDLVAGLDLEMPDSNGINDQRIIDAVKKGELAENVVNLAVERILDVIYRFYENRDYEAIFDREADHELARKIAGECLVLLKNDGILPLSKTDEVAFIGEFAVKPRFQGGGSSHINASKVESALEVAKEMRISYARGYDIKSDTLQVHLIEEAVICAKEAKAVVIFAGLPDDYESEGFDRTHMKLPDYQNQLIFEVAKVNPNIVVVLHNGSPVEMPWVNDVKAIIELYLGGQAVGGATVQALFGDINPSGRLAETFPIKLEDNPSYLYYLGEEDIVEYREGIFVGYRYYDKKKMDVLFPFGHGLSYTCFEYSNLKLSKSVVNDTEELVVTVDVTNVGNQLGKEVVQLYVAPQNSNILRPVRELKGFDKVELEVGQTKQVTFKLSSRAYAYFNISAQDWLVETGTYEIQIGKSSRDIILIEKVEVIATKILKKTFSLDSTFSDLMKHPIGFKALEHVVEDFTKAIAGNGVEDEILGEGSRKMFDLMVANMPLRNIVSFGGLMNFEQCLQILDMVNK